MPHSKKGQRKNLKKKSVKTHQKLSSSLKKKKKKKINQLLKGKNIKLNLN